MFHKENGQINILGLAGLGVTICIFAVGTFLANSYRNDARVDAAKAQSDASVNSIKGEVGYNSQRISKLEEAISTLKTDNSEIKKDVKTILQIIR